MWRVDARLLGALLEQWMHAASAVRACFVMQCLLAARGRITLRRSKTRRAECRGADNAAGSVNEGDGSDEWECTLRGLLMACRCCCCDDVEDVKYAKTERTAAESWGGRMDNLPCKFCQ